MNIYEFIRSRDVAAHCQTINKTWNTHEMAVIISRSNRTMEERHKAWQELIDSYPDMPAPPNIHRIEFDSIHKKLAGIMEYDRLVLERVMMAEQNAVYTYSIKYSESDDHDDHVFYSCEKALAAAKKHETAYGIVVTKSYIDCDDGQIEVKFDCNGNVYTVLDYSGEELSVKRYPGFVYSESSDYIFEMFYVDIPIPFKRGDILTYPPCNYRFLPHRIFLLDSLSCDNPKYHERAIRGECGDGSDLMAWGYFVSDNGVLYGDHAPDYDCFEYYNGKLEDNRRLLHYVNLFIKDKIDLPVLLNVQCRIIAEHQLKNDYFINAHGAFISEELLAENRLTSDEKDQI